ncbi:MAG: hypothetical protein IJ274_10545 [Lachnospiraceae bacterium]|nr:hypothetical protein [Lachnospiraceae bacterium]
MSEWNEQKIDEELEALLNDMPEPDELEKRIDKMISKKIRKTVLHTLTGVAIILLFILLYINPLMNYSFFDPYSMDKEPDRKMLGIMRDYCETVYPYREVLDLQVKRKGLGRYNIQMQVDNLTEKDNDSVANVWFDIKFSFFGDIIDAESILIPDTDRFSQGDVDKNELIEKISELPKSSIVYMSVSEEKAKHIEELRNMCVQLQWFQVYQPNVTFQGGMNYQPRSIFAEDDNRVDMTEQELLDSYINNLHSLEWEVEAWAGFGLADGSTETYFSYFSDTLFDTRRDAMSLTSLNVENYCVYGKRDEVIQFLQEHELDSILIENVSLW